MGWRGCALQRVHGPDGFLHKIKLRGYRAAIESQIPPGPDRDRARFVVHVLRPEGPTEKEMGYAELVRDLDDFGRGIPDCASCPLAGGQAVGCTRYVTYPIDAVCEQAAFAFVAGQIESAGSVAQRFFEARASALPRAGSGWHVRRGPGLGGLATLARPLEHVWGGWFSRRRIDSAQILFALTSPDPRGLALHASFLDGFVAHCAATASRSTSIDELASLVPFFRALAANPSWSLYVDA